MPQNQIQINNNQVTQPVSLSGRGLNYFFFLRNDPSLPMPDWYQKIIETAQSKIEIWDPYIHYTDHKIFASLRNPVEIAILTLSSSQKWNNQLSNYITALKQNVPDQFRANISGKIAFIDKDRHGDDEINGKWQFHDRFLIIDDADFYIIGASIAHHLSPKQSTGIMTVEHAEDKEIIRKAFDETLDQTHRDSSYYSFTDLS